MRLAHVLANKLRQLRGDLTQDAFAKKLGISRATLARLESCSQNTTIATLERIAKSLKCSICELLSCEDNK